MAGRGFLNPARDSVRGATSDHWRSAAVDTYYALMLECRDTLLRWGLTLPRRDNLHTWVRLRFLYAKHAELKGIGDVLEDLGKLRNKASYDQSPLAEFASPKAAQDSIQDSADALALLDAIDGDPARRAAAIASLPP